MITARRETLAVLSDLCESSPEIRLGQLLSHLAFLTEAHLGKHLVDVDEDELLSILHRHQAELTARSDNETAELTPATASGIT